MDGFEPKKLAPLRIWQILWEYSETTRPSDRAPACCAKGQGGRHAHSFRFDLIMEYFIRRGNYDIFQINESCLHLIQYCWGREYDLYTVDEKGAEALL